MKKINIPESSSVYDIHDELLKLSADKYIELYNVMEKRMHSTKVNYCATFNPFPVIMPPVFVPPICTERVLHCCSDKNEV